MKWKVEDTLVATLEFANGALGTLEATTSAYPGYDRRLELTGSEGTIIVERDRITSADLKHNFGVKTAQPTEDLNRSSSSPIISDVTGHKKIIEDFLKAIATGQSPLCDGREGRRSVELVAAAYESARTGSAVSIGEI